VPDLSGENEEDREFSERIGLVDSKPAPCGWKPEALLLGTFFAVNVIILEVEVY
jgi:hypothetical protein